MKKAVLYARVSSKEQEEEGYSIPAQLELLREYAKKNIIKVIKEFIDVETAKKAGRSQFNEMIDFLKNNKDIDIILCEKTDRLYRNLRDLVTLDEMKITLHLVKENTIISPESNSDAQFFHLIKVGMAKKYIDNLSEETRKGLLQKAREGFYPSYAPLGYFNVEKNINGRRIKAISIDKSRAHLIKKLFELYATGSYSLKDIAVYAFQEGLRSRKGFKLYKSTLFKILKDPIYTGNFLWDGKLYEGKHEPIIQKELYDGVQAVFESYNRPKVTKHRNFAFTGLVKCAKCGCSVTAEIKKNRYIYYHCTRYKGKCGNKVIRENELISQFGEIIKKINIDKSILDWIKETLKLSHKDEKEFHDQQIVNLRKLYDKLQRRIDQLYIDKLDGVITKEFYESKNKEWRDEQEQIEIKLETHRKANTSYLEQGIKILELSQMLYSSWKKQNHEGKRKILDLLLSNCSLNAGRLYPTYRKPFDMLAKGLSRSNWLLG